MLRFEALVVSKHARVRTYRTLLPTAHTSNYRIRRTTPASKNILFRRELWDRATARINTKAVNSELPEGSRCDYNQEWPSSTIAIEALDVPSTISPQSGGFPNTAKQMVSPRKADSLEFEAKSAGVIYQRIDGKLETMMRDNEYKQNSSSIGVASPFRMAMDATVNVMGFISAPEVTLFGQIERSEQKNWLLILFAIPKCSSTSVHPLISF